MDYIMQDLKPAYVLLFTHAVHPMPQHWYLELR